MAEPPSLAGAAQVKKILVVSSDNATNSVGAPGTVTSVPVVASSTLEGVPVPLVLMAETR